MEEIPKEKGKFLLGWFGYILHALGSDNPFALTTETRKEETLIRWEAPPEGWALLNTDGASKGNPGIVSGGGVLRGYQ